MALLRGIVAVLQILFALQANAYDECEEIGICEHADDYPTELVQDLIKELKSKNTIFNKDEFEIDLGFRFNDDIQELCEITKKQMAPTKAKDAKGVMRYIVNDKNNPVQKFNTAICNNRGSKCNDFLGFLPNYRSVCIQKSVLRQMIYVNDKNQTAVDYFKVPICCSCELLRTD
ncbi:neurotrophin 1-like [Maniola jurtina]|uniref:neurotrophin 1-like n=1 Tax=Maniola jurtina TaxID=191418 RepID=UPI001E689EE1|nr:neurotrophin 1-like [Maniola jurtina]